MYYICCTLQADKMQGTKRMNKTNKRSAKDRAIIQEVAQLTGYSESMVEKVIKNDRQNEFIMNTYMVVLEGFNELREAVKLLVPFPERANPKKQAI